MQSVLGLPEGERVMMILAPIVHGRKENSKKSWKSWQKMASFAHVLTLNCFRSTKRYVSINAATTQSKLSLIAY